MRRTVYASFLTYLCVLFLATSPSFAEDLIGDLNCDDDRDVLDVQISIFYALALPLSPVIDADQDGVHDDCNGTLCGGLTPCGDTYADLNTDRIHCGSCNNACAPGNICEGGSCVLSCSNALTSCGEFCVDVWNNNEHCGACDNICADHEKCVMGACEIVGAPPALPECEHVSQSTSVAAIDPTQMATWHDWQLSRNGSTGEMVDIVVEARITDCWAGQSYFYFSNFDVNGMSLNGSDFSRTSSGGPIAAYENQNEFFFDACPDGDEPVIIRWTATAPLYEGSNQLHVYWSMENFYSGEDRTLSVFLGDCEEEPTEAILCSDMTSTTSLPAYEPTPLTETFTRTGTAGEVVDFVITGHVPECWTGGCQIQIDTFYFNGNALTLEDAVQADIGGSGAYANPYGLELDGCPNEPNSQEYTPRWTLPLTLLEGENTLEVSWTTNSPNYSGEDRSLDLRWGDDCIDSDDAAYTLGYNTGYSVGESNGLAQCIDPGTGGPSDPASCTDTQSTFTFSEYDTVTDTQTLTRTGTEGEWVELTIQVTIPECWTGSSEITFETLEFNGQPISMVDTAQFHANGNGAYIQNFGPGQDVTGIWADGCPNDATLPYIAEFKKLVPLQAGENTLEWTQETISMNNGTQPRTLEVRLGECVTQTGPTACTEASVSSTVGYGNPTYISNESQYLTWSSETPEVVNVTVQLTVEANPGYTVEGDIHMDFANSFDLNGNPFDVSMLLPSSYPIIEQGTTQQPSWNGWDTWTTIQTPLNVPYSVAWSFPLPLEAGDHVLAWELSASPSLFPGVSQTIKVFVEECESDTVESSCSADGSVSVTLEPNTPLPLTPVSISTTGSAGQLVEVLFTQTTPMPCDDGVGSFDVYLQDFFLNGDDNMQFFMDSILPSAIHSDGVGTGSFDGTMWYFNGCFDSSSGGTTQWKTHVILAEGLNTLEWNWQSNGFTGGTENRELEVRFGNCQTGGASSGSTPPTPNTQTDLLCPYVTQGHDLQPGMVAEESYSLVRTGTAGESAEIQFVGTVPECWTGPLDLYFQFFTLNGVQLDGNNLTLSVENGDPSCVGCGYSFDFNSVALDGCPYVAGEPMVATWTIPVVLQEGINTLEWAHNETNSNYSGEQRTFDVIFGECTPLD